MMPTLKGSAYRGRVRLPRLALIVAALVAATESAHVQSQPPAPLIDILQAELRRNLDTLKTSENPAYFIGYTVHDTRSTRLAASDGALLRSDESQTRAASVEVRVGDYTFDNTHPLRGDGNVGPRITRVNLTLTDTEAPIRLELWRGTDRAYRQAAEALTRARTNAAAKIQDEKPAPDFSREEPQVHRRYADRLHARHRRLGRPAAPAVGAVQRGSAHLPQRCLAVGRSDAIATTPTAKDPGSPPASCSAGS